MRFTTRQIFALTFFTAAICTILFQLSFVFVILFNLVSLFILVAKLMAFCGMPTANVAFLSAMDVLVIVGLTLMLNVVFFLPAEN